MKKIFLLTLSTLSIFGLHDVLAKVESKGKSAIGDTKVIISGQTNFASYITGQDQSSQNGGRGGHPHFTIEDTRLNFEATNHIDFLEWSALFGITGNTASGTTSVEEARLRFRSEFGTVILGVARGVADFMAVGAFKVMGGSGGFDGSYKNAINVSSGAYPYIDFAGFRGQKDGTKITYVMPRYQGFQFGVSYVPHTQQSGEAKQKVRESHKENTPFAHDLFELGLNYKNKFDNGLGLAVSLTGLLGQVSETPLKEGDDTYTVKRHSIEGWALGVLLDYAGFSFGAEYMENGKSMEAKKTVVTGAAPAEYTWSGNKAPVVWSVALGYQWGANGVALGYLNTSHKLGKTTDAANAVTDHGKANVDVISVTYDRKIAPGLTAYVDATHFNYKTSLVDDAAAATYRNRSGNPEKAVPTNKGHAVVMGIKAKF
jgi:outer membrane protein OmpU